MENKLSSPARQWMVEFADKHGVNLRFETPLPDGVPAYKYDTDNGSDVVLDSSLPDERLNFALAHEVAHILLNHSGYIEEDEEWEANRMASHLLLPEDEFAPNATMGLRELKELFPHASFEAIARRRLAFVQGVLTIADNGRIRSRITSEFFAAPSMVTPPEQELLRESLENSEDLHVLGEGVSWNATYVNDGRGVERVLLYGEES